jgi:hypothetical protein
MKPPLPRIETFAPRLPHVQLEIAKAIGTLMTPEDQPLRQRRAEIVALRRDLELLAGDIRKAFEEAAALVKAELRAALRKYSPDQPRVSAGNPAGGQWTKEDGESQSSTSPTYRSSRMSTERSEGPVRYASLEISPSNVLTDAPASGTRYAAGNESNEESEREERIEASPGQQIRLEIARDRLNSLISQVQRIDPNWSPTPGYYETAEGQISNLEAQVQEAREFLTRLRGLGFPRDPETGRRLSTPPNAITGDPLIDRTTKKLMDFLGDVMDGIGPRPDLDQGQYGTEVHTEFAKVLRAKALSGIESNDVERTFSLTEGAFYGAKYSIRPDAILRRDDGTIAAIYDVKTGRGMSETRVIRIRYMTDSERTVPVIELYRARKAILKHR